MSHILGLQNLIQGFKISCQTEGKSPKTIEWYTGFLNRFLQFLETCGYPTEINKVDKTHIRTFIIYLQQEARTPHTGRTLSQFTVQVSSINRLFSIAVNILLITTLTAVDPRFNMASVTQR